MFKLGHKAWNKGQKGLPQSSGHKPWNEGKTHSEKTKQKIREARANQDMTTHGMSIKNWWIQLKADPERYAAYIAKLKNRKVWNKGKAGWMSLEGRANINKNRRGKPNLYALGKKRPDITGESHYNYGKPAVKGTGRGKGSYCLKGHWVRSTWERAVADWLFTHEIAYGYEPCLFDLGGGVRYRPDFHILDNDVWIEVKGFSTPRDQEKMRKFVARGYKLRIFDRFDLKDLLVNNQMDLAA